MLMNTTFLGDSFSIKWQSRVADFFVCYAQVVDVLQLIVVYPDFATCSILTIEKNVENTAFGLYFFNFML